MIIEQYSVYWVTLDPTQGAEVSKKRPCVVITPTVMNRLLGTVIVVPITSTERNFVFRFPVDINTVKGWVMTDQMRSVDKSRISNYIGELEVAQTTRLKEIIQEMLVE